MECELFSWTTLSPVKIDWFTLSHCDSMILASATIFSHSSIISISPGTTSSDLILYILPSLSTRACVVSNFFRWESVSSVLYSCMTQITVFIITIDSIIIASIYDFSSNTDTIAAINSTTIRVERNCSHIIENILLFFPLGRVFDQNFCKNSLALLILNHVFDDSNCFMTSSISFECVFIYYNSSLSCYLLQIFTFILVVFSLYIHIYT